MNTQYENKCRTKFYELLDATERTSGYSHSQVVSVMTVMDCSVEEAQDLLDKSDDYGILDWSEASWEEMKIFFAMVKFYCKNNEKVL